MRINAALAVLCYLTCAISLAQAQTLVLETVVTGEMNHIFNTPSGRPNQNIDFQSLGLITPNVSLSDYSAIQITVHAPTGTYWRVQPAQNETSQFVALDIRNIFDFPEEEVFVTTFNASWTFNFVEGGMGSLTNQEEAILAISQNTGSDLQIAVRYGVDGYFGFNSVTFSFEYDHSELPETALASFINPMLAYIVETESETDLGPRMTLQAIPEPASLMLLGTGSLLLLIRRQHDAC